jgi:hypothetical protein
MDTSATDHLMSEMAHLHAQESYHMHDHVHTDRSCMHISYIGHAFLPTHTSRNLILSNILHVSAVKNNLLTIKKFTRENDVFVEFRLMTQEYRGSQQSSREVKPKFIDSTQGEPKNICKP